MRGKNKPNNKPPNVDFWPQGSWSLAWGTAGLGPGATNLWIIRSVLVAAFLRQNDSKLHIFTCMYPSPSCPPCSHNTCCYFLLLLEHDCCLESKPPFSSFNRAWAAWPATPFWVFSGLWSPASEHPTQSLRHLSETYFLSHGSGSSGLELNCSVCLMVLSLHQTGGSRGQDRHLPTP